MWLTPCGPRRDSNEGPTPYSVRCGPRCPVVRWSGPAAVAAQLHSFITYHSGHGARGTVLVLPREARHGSLGGKDILTKQTVLHEVISPPMTSLTSSRFSHGLQFFGFFCFLLFYCACFRLFFSALSSRLCDIEDLAHCGTTRAAGKLRHFELSRVRNESRQAAASRIPGRRH